MAAGETGWQAILGSIGSLSEADLTRTITIRGEPHTVQQAVIRGVLHAAYHVGQILYVARLVNPTAPWLTIAPGASGVHRPGYLRQA
jgi:hypothetical protein